MRTESGTTIVIAMAISTEQRRVARVSLRAVAQLHVRGLNEEIPVEVRNFSKAGMAVEARHLPAPGSRIDCRLILNSGSWVLPGKIAWSRPDAYPVPRAGIEFVDLCRADEAVLTQVVLHQVGAAPMRSLDVPDTERIQIGDGARHSGHRRAGWIVGVGTVAVVTGAMVVLAVLWNKPASAPSRERLPGPVPTATLASGPRLQQLPAQAEAQRASLPALPASVTIVPGHNRSTVRIALSGLTSGAHSYRLSEPPGMVVRLPRATVPPSEHGRFFIERAGIGRVWIEEREGGLHLRVLPQRGWALLVPEVGSDNVTFTSVR